MRVITPSITSAWEGTPVEGSPYTRQQLHVMKQERPHWTRFDNHPVTLTARPQQPWDEPEQIVVLCPIIARTKDRKRVLIIAPGGDKKWMDAEPSPD